MFIGKCIKDAVVTNKLTQMREDKNLILAITAHGRRETVQLRTADLSLLSYDEYG